MLDCENLSGDDIPEPVIFPSERAVSVPNGGGLVVRRRIEHLRELKRLREMLDDPEFDELN